MSGGLMIKLDSLRWFSQRRSRTQVLCVQCDVSSDRIALLMICITRHDSAKCHIWGRELRTPAGGYDPQIRIRPRSLCNAPIPSFIILYLLVRKLSCWHTHTNQQTNPQTNRRRRKHPTFFATLQRWVKNTNANKQITMFSLISIFFQNSSFLIVT